LYREFIITQNFDRCWTALKLSENTLRELQNVLLENPKIGEVVPDTGGVRKMRLAAFGKGKSGGIRVIYLDIEKKSQLYLLLVYPKSVKETLTAEDKKVIASLTSELKGA